MSSLMKVSITLLCLLVCANSVHASDKEDTSDTKEDVVPMSAEIAQSRIQQALNSTDNVENQIKIYQEVIERCEDPDLVSISHYNLGTLALETYFDLQEESVDAATVLVSTEFENSILSFREADLLSSET